jgi:hypothetical protein
MAGGSLDVMEGEDRVRILILRAFAGVPSMVAAIPPSVSFRSIRVSIVIATRNSG